MEIQLLKTASEPERLNKATTPVATVQGTMRTPSSILAFSATIQGIANRNCNYCYIPDFNRYYFINDITIENNQEFTISCKVDVLMSYKDEIKNLDVIVARNAKKWNLYLDDGTLKSYNKPLMNQLKFPNGFNKREFILLVAGGGSATAISEDEISAHADTPAIADNPETPAIAVTPVPADTPAPAPASPSAEAPFLAPASPSAENGGGE